VVGARDDGDDGDDGDDERHLTDLDTLALAPDPRRVLRDGRSGRQVNERRAHRRVEARAEV